MCRYESVEACQDRQVQIIYVYVSGIVSISLLVHRNLLSILRALIKLALAGGLFCVVLFWMECLPIAVLMSALDSPFILRHSDERLTSLPPLLPHRTLIGFLLIFHHYGSPSTDTARSAAERFSAYKDTTYSISPPESGGCDQLTFTEDFK